MVKGVSIQITFRVQREGFIDWIQGFMSGTVRVKASWMEDRAQKIQCMESLYGICIYPVL